MASAIVLGGSGCVGRAVVDQLIDDGWTVTVTGRSPERCPERLLAGGARFVHSDRHDEAALREALGPGADVVVDCVGYTAAHARMLLAAAADVGSLVFISSKAVYVDGHGRHSNSPEPPDFGGPVTEQQPTMPPSDEPYRSAVGYGANKTAAEQVYLDGALPTSVLRPSRIHGPGAARAREWYFVKRVLDGRRHVLLARGGRGVNHPTASVNLAALVAVCAAAPADRVLNSADPDAPDGLAIATAVASHLGHRWAEQLLPDRAPAGLGAHPWDTVPPFVLDTTASATLGYRPVGTYAQTVAPAIDELVAAAGNGDPRGLLPAAEDPYFRDRFDYAAEDRWLAGTESLNR